MRRAGSNGDDAGQAGNTHGVRYDVRHLLAVLVIEDRHFTDAQLSENVVAPGMDGPGPADRQCVVAAAGDLYRVGDVEHRRRRAWNTPHLAGCLELLQRRDAESAAGIDAPRQYAAVWHHGERRGYAAGDVHGVAHRGEFEGNVERQRVAVPEAGMPTVKAQPVQHAHGHGTVGLEDERECAAADRASLTPHRRLHCRSERERHRGNHRHHGASGHHGSCSDQYWFHVGITPVFCPTHALRIPRNHTARNLIR